MGVSVGRCRLGGDGVILTAGQLAPPKKGLSKIYEVHQGFDGETRIRGRAAIRAAFHEMEQIDGVVDVDGRIRAKRLHLNVEIDDRANLTDIENEARRRLDHEFWINLGLADFGINTDDGRILVPYGILMDKPIRIPETVADPAEAD